MDHTQLARDYYARRLRAEGATTAVLRLINYHCHSFTFAIRRVYVCPTLYCIRRRDSRTICASTVLPSRRFYTVIHPLL